MRTFIALVAVTSALFAPWWVPALFMIALSLRYEAWEVPLVGFFMDLLWLPQGGHLILPMYTIFGIAVVWLASPLRKQLLL